MPSYQFRLSKRNGALHLQHFDTCADDNAAMEIGRRITTGGGADQFRLEIWRNEDCIYDGVPSGWPFRRGKGAKPSPRNFSRAPNSKPDDAA